ncbi:hypothetical protein T484DRAFT_1861754, partial [Baffinella frigidus]
PTQPYPADVRAAHYQTLGSSETTFHEWNWCDGAGTIGDIFTQGSHSLRVAILDTWPESATLRQLADSTDFGPDILEPQEPPPPRIRKAPPNVRQREASDARHRRTCIRSEQTMAAHYNSSTFEHRDINQQTGLVDTLHSVIIGAAVFPCQFNPNSTDHQAKSLRVSEEQTEAVDEYASSLHDAVTRLMLKDDDYALEYSPITASVTMAKPPPAATSDSPIYGDMPQLQPPSPELGPRQPDGDTHLRPGSSMVDLSLLPDTPTEAHVAPIDRAASSAMLEIPAGLSDAPANIREALRRPDWEEWKKAIQAEMDTLIGNNTIELGTPPAGAQIVQAMVQLRLKRDEHGNPSRRKARYCARGDT